jgi:hypothetical protein
MVFGRFIRSLALISGGMAWAVLAWADGRAAAGARAVVEVTPTAEVGWDSNVHRASRGPLAYVDSPYAQFGVKLEARCPSGWSVAYTPTATAFGRVAGEDHQRHVVALEGQARGEDWSAKVKLGGVLVAGPNHGGMFMADHNAFATGQLRERRDQAQGRADVSVRRDFAGGFARAVGNAVAYDLRSHAITAPMSDNFVDRGDLLGGFDLGHAWVRQEGWVGWRVGHQEQDRDGGRASDRSNDYQRFLVGAAARGEGAWKWQIQGGVEAHDYAVGSLGPTEVVAGFGDAELTWRASARTRWQASAKLGQGVSGSGLTSTRDGAFQVSVKQSRGATWEWVPSLKLQTANYDGRDREDWLFSAGLAVAWKPRKQATLTFSAQQELARDHGEIDRATREYDRTQLGVSAGWVF